MNKLKAIPQKIFQNSRNRLVFFVGIFCLIGLATLLVSRAATGSEFAVSPQLGTLSGNASVVSNSAAIGGNALQFGSASTSTSGTSGSGSGSGSGTSSTSSSGIITASDSKSHCIYLPGGTDGEISDANLTAAEKVTGLTYNCLESFDNPVDNWTDWEEPWQFTNDPSTTDSGSWENWLSTGHQMILGVDLIPQSAGSPSNPLTWEESCAAGDYNSYAIQLAKNLVSYGAGKIVIRLGIEANGSWEQDYVGSSSTEMSDWAKCYDNEVTSMRSVANTGFLFVWNPNICTMDFPLSDWYPGNSYVDIIGADAYDADCHNDETVAQEGWQDYYTDSLSSPGTGFPSISNIIAFAQANNKPMSFPEWGLGTGDDDATYMTNMTQLFNTDNFAFESYFDSNDDGIAPLGSTIPNSTAAYEKDF